jgi:hypothetical protein
MTTRAAFVWAIGFCVSLAALASGCHIELDRDFDGDKSDDPMLDEVGVCPAFCQHLMNCENIATDAFESCLSHCEQQRSVTPTTAVPGIHCVIEQTCSSVIGYGCPSAPFPPAAGSNVVGTCEADSDCQGGGACVEGTCKQPCNASCECAEGEMCEGGYCQVPAEPPATCTTDCDCPGGNACIEGICIPNA